MACFLVPAVEAVVVSLIAQAAKRKRANSPAAASGEGHPIEEAVRLPLARKLRWLSNLLWGGSALLAFEHLWHGEVVPWFPFLTAAGNPADASVMLNEMATVGVSMAALVTLTWIGMVAVTSAMARKNETQKPGTMKEAKSL
jgi:hypothetical protein